MSEDKPEIITQLYDFLSADSYMDLNTLITRALLNPDPADRLDAISTLNDQFPGVTGAYRAGNRILVYIGGEDRTLSFLRHLPKEETTPQAHPFLKEQSYRKEEEK